MSRVQREKLLWMNGWGLGLVLSLRSWRERANWDREVLSAREGNGTPLQYSCLENPMDGGAWEAAVHAKGWTLPFHFLLSCIEENGNPLQCSCLENPRDGGAWWAAVYGVAQSRT